MNVDAFMEFYRVSLKRFFRLPCERLYLVVAHHKALQNILKRFFCSSCEHLYLLVAHHRTLQKVFEAFLFVPPFERLYLLVAHHIFLQKVFVGCFPSREHLYLVAQRTAAHSSPECLSSVFVLHVNAYIFL